MSARQDQIKDLWEIQERVWDLNESAAQDPRVDGNTVLGVVRGPFFVPDGVSRNNRFYPAALWEDVLSRPEIKMRLDERLMYGCIGHEDKEVCEKDLTEGKASHIVSRLWIDEKGVGMGEALILGTDSGKNLYIYLKAGSRLRTSSRGSGKMESVSRDGVPVVDKTKFTLETFDFVLRAGFSQAAPSLQEQQTEQDIMDPITEKLVTQLQESRDSLQEQLLKVVQEKDALIAEKATLVAGSEKNAVLLTEANAKGGQLAEILAASKLDAPALKQVVEALGPDGAKLVQEGLNGKALGEYKSIGSPAEIKAIVESATKTLSAYRAIGSPKDILETINSATKSLTAIRSIGTVAQIRKLSEDHKKMVVSVRETQVLNRAKKLSEKFSAPIEKVKTLLARHSFTETSAILEGLLKPVAPKPSKAASEVSLLAESASGRFFSSQMSARPVKAPVAATALAS